MAFPLNNEAHGIGTANRIMRHTRRQQKHLALADRHVDRLAVLLYLYNNVAFKLVEKLAPNVPVIILSRIRPADDHNDKFISVINALIPNRRLEQMPVLVDPLFEIERAANHNLKNRLNPN